MEDDDLRAFGDGGRLPEGERESLHAVLLEAAAPGRGPVADLALGAEVRGQEFLLVAVALAHGVEVGAEILEHVWVRARGPAVHRGVTGVVALLPIADDQELAGVLEEPVHVADDDDVDVEEEHLALEFRAAGGAERRGEGDELGPAALGRAGGQFQTRDREGFDVGVQTIAIIREADEAVRDREVTTHHGVEPVDVLGTVLGAPLHAEDRGHAGPHPR